MLYHFMNTNDPNEQVQIEAENAELALHLFLEELGWALLMPKDPIECAMETFEHFSVGHDGKQYRIQIDSSLYTFDNYLEAKSFVEKALEQTYNE